MKHEGLLSLVHPILQPLPRGWWLLHNAGPSVYGHVTREQLDQCQTRRHVHTFHENGEISDDHFAARVDNWQLGAGSSLTYALHGPEQLTLVWYNGNET